MSGPAGHRLSAFTAAVALATAAVAFSARGEDGESASQWNLRGSLTAFSAFEYNDVDDRAANLANPGNTLTQPRYRLLQDFRPLAKIQSDIGFQAVAKPWLQLFTEHTYVAGSQPVYTQHIELEWVEAYATADVTETVSITAGRQNYQWGPGELFSPSNQVFRFFIDTNTPLFYLRGRNLFRVNWTPRKDLSFVALAEVERNNDAEFQFSQPFHRKAAVKGEKTFELGESDSVQAAVIAGTDEDQAHWLGQFAQLTLGESWMLYADASQNFRHDPYSPAPFAAAPGTIVMTQDHPLGRNRLFARALGGARYSFEGGEELRVEYLYNGLGWTRDEYGLALRSSLLAPSAAAAASNTAAFLAPGLDFKGRHYAYGSLRIGDAGHEDQVTYFIRYLHSLTDHSGSGILNVEWTPEGSWALVGSVLAQRGAKDTEMTQFGRLKGQVAVRFDF